MGLRVSDVLDEEITKAEKNKKTNKNYHTYYWEGQLRLLKRIQRKLRKHRLIL